MKTGMIIGIVVVVIILLVGAFFIFSGNKNNSSSNSNTSLTGAQTYNVDLSGFAFSPLTLTIKQGDMVIWTNKDSTGHTVTSDSGTELASSTLSTGQTYSHTFSTTGNFDYHCSIHPMMKAKIIVQ
jgi:plastocyanin